MLKLFEIFGGIGAATTAAKRVLGEENVNVVNYIEKEKAPVMSYNAINGTNFKPTDANDVDLMFTEEVDLMVAGWPCQDLSISGKGLGLKGERSNLILLTIKKVEEMIARPKYILLENVKGLASIKHQDDLAEIRGKFEELGYSWDQAILNSKYFGVPQARERVFMLLSRNDVPKKTIGHLKMRSEVTTTIRDIIDFEAEAIKFEGTANGFNLESFNELPQYNNKVIMVNPVDIDYQQKDKINKVATLGEYDKNGVFKPIAFASDRHFIGIDGQAKTLLANDCHKKNKIMYEKDGSLFYRNLTPRECWKLMGFSDKEFIELSSRTKILKNGKEREFMSVSQLTTQAGNSIVVNVLEEIIKVIVDDKGE